MADQIRWRLTRAPALGGVALSREDAALLARGQVRVFPAGLLGPLG
jgi:hypothetical protein